MAKDRLSKHERRVVDLALKYGAAMNLGNWDIHIKFPKPFPNDHGPDCYAFTAADWEYEQAIINFNSAKTKDASDIILHETIVHELVHCWLDCLTPKDNAGSGQLERITTQISRALVKRYGDIDD